MLPAEKARSVAQARVMHLQCLVPDGIWRRTGGEAVFQDADAPDTAEPQALGNSMRIGRDMTTLR